MRDRESSLRQRIEELEEENAQMRAALGALDGCEDWYRYGLTPGEMKIFQALRRRKIATTQQLLFALYPNDPDRRAEVELNIIRVIVSNLRRKLRPAGVEIRCARNVGWWLEHLHSLSQGRVIQSVA
jgi:DNA-binding response OmpR family regulator